MQIVLGLSSKDPKLLIGGIDFYRCFEYAETIQKLNRLEGKIVLDIGSSDTVFPQFMAKEGAEVYAVDILDTVKKQRGWSDALEVEVGALIADGKLLPFRDNTVDICTCISTIEHAQPSDGDTLIMREIERVLSPGGLAFVSIPYSRTYDERLYPDRRGFMRRYNENSLHERVVGVTALRLINKIYYGDERYCGVANAWYQSPIAIKVATAWMRTFIGSFIVSNTTPSKAGGVFLVFRKLRADRGCWSQSMRNR